MMKKLNEKVAILFVLGTFIIGSCAKEEVSGVQKLNGDTSISIDKQEVNQVVESKDGLLVFQNEQHMMNQLESLAKMDMQQKVDWENNLDFLSLASIEMIVNNTEFEHKEIFYQGLNPDLQASEYKALGYRYEHTEIYKKYLDSGVIYEELDSDGNTSFNLTMRNSGVANVLNEAGEVIVGNHLYQFSGFDGTITSLEDNMVVNSFSIVSNGEKQNLFTWSAGLTNDSWINLSSNQRISYKVIGYSLNSGSPTLIGSTFYANAKAQKKSFGSWSYSSYYPVYRITGNWTYNFSVLPNGQFSTIVVSSTDTNPIITLNDNDNTSPYNYLIPGGGNNVLLYFKPNGSWIISNIYSVVNSIDVQHSFTFSFSGGCCGYNYTVTG
jgi:hypothetical protein